MLNNGSYTYAYFFWILSTIKMKFGQILVCCLTNISNMFLAQCCTLQTSSRPFYFIKMTIYQDLAILNSWHLPFLNVSYSHFQKSHTCEESGTHFWHLLMNLKNKLSLKNFWSGSTKNKIILVFSMTHFFKNNKEKHL